MIITTVEKIPGRNILKSIDIVTGSTVRSRNIGMDILAGLRNIIGGEIKSYTELQDQARKQAMNRMIDSARELGADAIVGVKLTTSMVMHGASEILAYGTAVKLG